MNSRRIHLTPPVSFSGLSDYSDLNTGKKLRRVMLCAVIDEIADDRTDRDVVAAAEPVDIHSYLRELLPFPELVSSGVQQSWRVLPAFEARRQLS